ncbi:MAG: DoxX family membrane protein [Candidatus Eremiobacteraeota bacterium]|nr:DoxX family membrane protein [Candidatus Eremiobacteraeota bacterium]
MDGAVFVGRLIVGGLLIVAGGLKVGHASELASAIAAFRMLPAGIIGPVALALPYVEILLGLYLIGGLFTRAVAIVVALQFALYGAAIASAVLRHIPAACGCFGPNDTSVADWPHAGFDFTLALGSLFLAWRAPGAFALDRKLRSA